MSVQIRAESRKSRMLLITEFAFTSGKSVLGAKKKVRGCHRLPSKPTISQEESTSMSEHNRSGLHLKHGSLSNCLGRIKAQTWS